ncbi:MAG: 23S rRNA (pseudouridine(1915)-N(3))-methyltransferase RlmH [Acidobacteriota bacterium]|jgi:23S rRNA (pseudouridine1915-N3)-methyltransferase
MGEILLAWVGRAGEPEWETLSHGYAERIRRFVRLDVVRVRPEAGREQDPERARVREGERLLALLRPADRLVALDEGGEQLTTEQLAASVAAWLGSGRVVMAIGSDLGLSPAVRAHAQHLLALSRLTLPHALARVLLLEQLFRVLDLNAGGAYHRGHNAKRGVRYNSPPGRQR